MMFVFQSAIRSSLSPGTTGGTGRGRGLFLEAPPEGVGVVRGDLGPSVEDGAEAHAVRRPGLPDAELALAHFREPVLTVSCEEEQRPPADVHAEGREPRVVRAIEARERLPSG